MKVDTPRGGQGFDLLEATPELLNGGSKRSLGFDPEVPRHVHDGEQQVADLLVHQPVVAGSNGLAHFRRFLGDLRQRAIDIGPVEPHLRCLALHRVRVGQRRL